MTNDWKPGDLALLTWFGDDPVMAFRVARCPATDHPTADHWHTSRGSYGEHPEAARRLVVIDPEDPEAVKRLGDLFRSQPGDNNLTRLQAALREFAAPKPDEPTGLGAVVEDAMGHKFVRVAEHFDGWAKDRDWQRIGGEVNAVRNFGWAQINAVKVLSEGVTA